MEHEVIARLKLMLDKSYSKSNTDNIYYGISKITSANKRIRKSAKEYLKIQAALGLDNQFEKNWASFQNF